MYVRNNDKSLQGAQGEALVVAEAYRLGYPVFIPAFLQPAYDLIIAGPLGPMRVQVKTTIGQEIDFRQVRRKNGRHYSQDAFDYFGVVVFGDFGEPEIFLVPHTEFPRKKLKVTELVFDDTMAAMLAELAIDADEDNGE
jgi:hypothetical protein